MLRAHGLSDKGHVRPTNEDCFAIDESLRLCVVADGLGGHNAGEIAARTAVDTVVTYVRTAPHPEWPFGFDPTLSAEGNLLRNAIYMANLRVLELAATADAYTGMGTTIVASLVVDNRLIVGHVGDSRLYVMNGDALRQLTDDDSWMATVLAGEPQQDDRLLQHHPMRNALTNVVGARMRTDVHVAEEPLAGGERLLLSTDGVHGVLDDRWISRILGSAADAAGAATQLVAAALARGSRDNCTAIVAEYDRTDFEP